VPGDQPAGGGWCNQCGVRFQPVAVGQPAGPWAPAPELAGVWPRIGARLLDALLVGLVVGVVGGLLGLPDNVGLLLTLVAAMIGYETLMLRW
jgi:hypothetical protein